MEAKTEESVSSIMASLRLSSERDLRFRHQNIDAQTTSFKQSLSSIRATSLDSVQSRGRVLEAKAKLREAENDLVKAISVKNRKEAKRIALMDSLMATKSVVEELKRNVQEQRTKRDEYDEILSQQSSVSKETCSQNGTDELQEAIAWYEKVLGFRVEGGHGVKFIFKNIISKHPNKEFSFTVRHADDTYTMLDCNPQLDNIKELVHELNRTNGLFKFVRVMRQKFQEAAVQGCLPHSTSLRAESSVVSASAPSISMSIDASASSTKKNEHQAQRGEVDRHPKKQNRGKTLNEAIISSPRSVGQPKGVNNEIISPQGSVRRSKGVNNSIISPPGSIRQSPRLMARKKT